MCGRNEEPWPSAMTHWKIATACAHCRAMDTHYQYWEISIDKTKNRSLMTHDSGLCTSDKNEDTHTSQ